MKTLTLKEGSLSVPCPQADGHTPAPDGYIQWHMWARLKAKTHKQTRCPSCGLYEVWRPHEL